MSDPNFAQSITYVCEHDDDGAMGIVVNRPMDLTVGDMFSHLNINQYDHQFDLTPVMCGGPVQMERGFVIHREQDTNWDSSRQLDDDIWVTSSRDILTAIANNEGPKDALIALGYAGWSAGQLDEEIIQNAWLSVPADPDIIFSIPCEQRWYAAAKLLGVDISLLSSQVGHA